MTTEQKIEYAVETEMLVEELNLKRLQVEAEEAVAWAKELVERARTNHKVTERGIRHAQSVAQWKVTRFKDEFDRIYRICPDEEEEFIMSLELPLDETTEPEHQEELINQFTDQSDPPNPWDNEGDDDNLVGA